MTKKLYLFDFDGTITYNDTYIDFFIFSFGKWYLFKKILSHFFKVFVLFIKRDFSELKEYLTGLFIKGKTKSELAEIAQRYVDQNLSKVIRPKALKETQQVQQDSANEIYIVSASLDLWMKPFAQKLKMKLICTELEFEDDIATGRFSSKNCKGTEKVNRIKKQINIDDFHEIFAYGNSSGDKEMLEMATHSFYKPF